MVHEGIVLGHLISSKGIEVDKAKIDVIISLPYPASVWEVCSFLGHTSFYKRFIRDFSKISLPLSKLLQKDVDFGLDQPCREASEELRRRLTTSSIWVMPPIMHLGLFCRREFIDYHMSLLMPHALWMQPKSTTPPSKKSF